MAEAILLNAAVLNKLQKEEDIYLYDIHQERVNYLKSTYPDLQIAKSPQEAVDGAELIIIAVKPQNIVSLGKSIKQIPKGTLLMSVCAGVTIDELRNKFGTENVIRTMPNTPAMILEGITCWYATPNIENDDKAKIQQLLQSFGEEIEVSEENYLDMATAVSGSGPAYLFLAGEAMIDAAVHMGFPRGTAEKLVMATLSGSANYAKSKDHGIASLKHDVTSPGGTTASALYELEKGRYRTVIADAIWAAYRKALELGGKDSNVGPGRNK